MADTLMYFKKLEAAGFSREQAEVQIAMVNDFTLNNFATKQDIDNHVRDLRGELKDLEQRMDARFVRLETELSRMGDRITIRLGGMMILGFGALAALIKIP